MSPSAIRRSTWYSKSGKAVSQAESACLHFSRLVFFSSLSDMPGAIHSSITARLPLFQSSSKYLRKTALFCSADMTRPIHRIEFGCLLTPLGHMPVHDQINVLSGARGKSPKVHGKFAQEPGAPRQNSLAMAMSQARKEKRRRR